MVLEQGQVESSAIYTHTHTQRAVSLVHPFLVLKSLSVYAYTQLYKVCSPSHVTNTNTSPAFSTTCALHPYIKNKNRTTHQCKPLFKSQENHPVLEKFSKYWSGTSVKHGNWSTISREINTFSPQTSNTNHAPSSVPSKQPHRLSQCLSYSEVLKVLYR